MLLFVMSVFVLLLLRSNQFGSVRVVSRHSTDLLKFEENPKPREESRVPSPCWHSNARSPPIIVAFTNNPTPSMNENGRAEVAVGEATKW
jgi:hypothetical protein